MYEKRFGLKRRPFPATPDDSLYYPSTGHEHALNTLIRAIQENEGIAILTGSPGTGKTLLAYCLGERLGTEVVSAFLPNSHLADRTALFQAILWDLKLPFEEGGEQILRLRLTDYILKTAAEKKSTVLIVDEAHHLSADLLEEIRLLGNLEAGARKAFQAILLGQPALLESLARPELAALRQRVAVRVALEPLGVEEAVDYLLHHLRQAGGRAEKIIDEAALESLARGSKGIPRLLNQAAQQALVLADAADLNQIDAEAALEALAALGLQSEEEAVEEEQTDGVPHFKLGESLRRTA